MYQVYTHPKYREHGKEFFKGVEARYAAYAKSLEDKLGIPHEKLTPLICIFVRACVHYALFEDEFYLKARWRKAKYPAAWTSGRYVVNAYVCRNCRSTSAS